MSAAVSELPQPATAQWYGVITRYRFERKAAAHLSVKGLESFVPLFSQVHHWSDRRKAISVPLFPGYIFVRVSLSSGTKFQILQTQGVLRLVSFAQEAVAVPVKQIEDLKTLLAHNVPCSLHAFLHVGQKVRIRGGCLDGLEGILAEKEKSLVISIDCIERSVAVKIEGYELELV